MIHNLLAYPEYRDSGLPWVGAIPYHWETRRCRFLFREVDERSKTGSETHLSMSQVHGLIPSSSLKRKQLTSESYAGGKLCKQGDLVLNRLKAHLGVFAHAKQAGVISPDYSVFRPVSDGLIRYYEALFKTPIYVGEFRRSTKGIVEGFWRLYSDDFYNIRALVPPRDEQDKIVAFLRAQDRQIAQFIRDKRRLIELLNEQKQTIIHRAVTRGLDPNVRLRPSGIDWLGDVPEHWVQKRLRNCISSIRNGVWGEDPTDLNIEDHITCVRVADFDLRQLGISRKKLTIRAVNSKDRVSRLLRDGDLLIEKSGGGDATPVGRVVANNIELKAVCSNFIGRITPNFDVIRSKYLLMVFSLLHEIGLVVPYIKQTTGIQNLDTNQYLSQNIFLPPLDEQDAVLLSIEELLKPIHEANDKALREIDLIREYRERLISDVVTGKVDVRGWTPSSEDLEADDEELAVIGDDEEIPAEEDGDAND